MLLFVVIAGSLFMLAGLVGISLSLQDLDQRLVRLSRVMDDRFGSWSGRANDRGADPKDSSQSGRKSAAAKSLGKA